MSANMLLQQKAKIVHVIDGRKGTAIVYFTAEALWRVGALLQSVLYPIDTEVKKCLLKPGDSITVFREGREENVETFQTLGIVGQACVGCSFASLTEGNCEAYYKK